MAGIIWRNRDFDNTQIRVLAMTEFVRGSR